MPIDNFPAAVLTTWNAVIGIDVLFIREPRWLRDETTPGMNIHASEIKLLWRRKYVVLKKDYRGYFKGSKFFVKSIRENVFLCWAKSHYNGERCIISIPKLLCNVPARP